PPATVQRRIGLGAPLRASEAASVAPPATVSPARERPAQGAPEPAVAPRLEVGVDLPLVQRSADPSGTAPTEPSPPAAEPPVQPAEPLDQPAAATAPHAPDPTPTPTTGPLGDLLTALPVTGEPRPTGDAPATIPSPAFEPPVVARQIAHRTGEDLAGEPPATTGAPVRPAADPHPGGPGASPTAAPLVQRASIDPPTVGGTIPTVAPPVRGGGAPVRATSPTTGLPVRPVSSPPPPAGAAAPETAPLLQRSSVPPTISPPSPTTGPAVERSGAPTPELPDAPGPGLPVVARAVADGAPDLDEAPTGLLDVLPLPSDPAPTTSGPSRPGTPVVQRAPLLSVARAPLLATSPRPPSTLAPHAGRPAPVSPSRSAVVQRADVAPVPAPVSLHALATPAPSSAAMPRTPDSRLAVTPPASPAAAGPMPVQPLPVQRVDAVVAMPAHPVQRAAGPSAGETDALPEEAVQTLTEPPTVQAVTPPEPASEPGPRGGSPSPFAAASAADLDELARRLTPPLLRRVRGQLLVDRERRGVRVDL
ncbi:hypothetical protein HP550_00830, partial [Cellulomonas humilata]|nr:hypothetical protein [Cellulomonas humilata]